MKSVELFFLSSICLFNFALDKYANVNGEISECYGSEKRDGRHHHHRLRYRHDTTLVAIRSFRVFLLLMNAR